MKAKFMEEQSVELWCEDEKVILVGVRIVSILVGKV